ncbi:hypothetical protein KAR91_85930 [Candidatus Pacearchaeota archaeon]|nr:hypothetical protein [Candidatus Pacearchaeota archaeon]
MSLKEPKELLRILDGNLELLRNNETLNKAEIKKLSDDLTELFNYVSSTTRKPSFTNALYTVTAQTDNQNRQFEKEREILNEHKDFVKNSFDKADQYLKTIQLGGYTAFFAVWGMTQKWIDPFWATLSVIFMLSSATVFIVWEIYRATLLTLVLKHHAKFVTGRIEQFLNTRMATLIKERTSVQSLIQSRAKIWLLCVSTAGVSLALLFWQLLNFLSSKL